MRSIHKILLLSVLLFHGFSVMAALPYTKCLIWSFENEDKLSDAQKRWLLRQATQKMNEKDVTVVQKQRSVTGNPHLYESLAIYAWRDPANPQGPYITRDCERNPESDLYCFRIMYAFSDRLMSFAKAYYLSGDKKYADACIRQLRAWCLDSKTYMEPQFVYGQFIPGTNNGLGYPGAVSEAYYLVNAIECIDFLKENNAIDKSTDKQLKAWFRKLANWMYNTEQGRSWGQVRDNLAIMYDILLYRVCLYTGQKNICRSIRNDFTVKRLNAHIALDGSQPRELLRPTAFTYSLYNLEHIVDFCTILERSGTHYYNNNRQRIDRAIDFIQRHVNTQNAAPYQEPSSNWERLAQNLQSLRQRVNLLYGSVRH